jgi:hypothetical protein
MFLKNKVAKIAKIVRVDTVFLPKKIIQYKELMKFFARLKFAEENN